MCKSVTAIS